MSDAASLATGLLAVITLATVVISLALVWLWAIGDIVWMLALKPTLIGLSLVLCGFAIVLATFLIIPHQHRVDGDLPILFAALGAPIVVRLLANQLARWDYQIRPNAYDFSVDSGQLKKSTLFLLVKADQIARYEPPVSQDKDMSKASSALLNRE